MMSGSCATCDGYMDWPRECPDCLGWMCQACFGSHECPLAGEEWDLEVHDVE